MVSVILGSWRDLEGDDVGQVFALGLGVMSVSTVWIAFFVIRSSIARPSSNAVKTQMKRWVLVSKFFECEFGVGAG